MNTKEFGNFGESVAKKELLEKGYIILEQNFYGSRGEIDIIALSPDLTTTVFIEVKTRQNKNYGMALESINKKKLKSMVNTAKQYLVQNPCNNEIRFDVFEVYCSKPQLVVTKTNHVINAFFDLAEYL